MTQDSPHHRLLPADSTARRILSRRLGAAEANPQEALVKGWYEDPVFCAAFFDRCEHQALVISPASLDLAVKAVELAGGNGDRHLKNRSQGVLVNAHIARTEFFWAGKLLHLYRDEALACCPRCRSDYFLRQGDLLGELGKPAEALEALAHCVEEGGDALSLDDHGRMRYRRGVAHHLAGHRERAIADAGHSILELALDAPPGLFLDDLAFFAVYIRGGDERHDRMALDYIRRFEQRIKGLDGWTEVRVRMAWVRAHLHARLGDVRRAREGLESVQAAHLVDGLAREAVGSAVDIAQLRVRPQARYYEPRSNDVKAARKVLADCAKRRSDLTPLHREGLAEMDEALRRRPEDAFAELVAFRKSFPSPVPGRLGERIGPPR